MIVIDGVDMVDVREAARLTGRTPETVRRWVWSGRLAAVKNGNKLFVRRADIAAKPTAVATADHDALSLRQWSLLLPDGPGNEGRSARDLVLEDRALRGDGASR